MKKSNRRAFFPIIVLLHKHGIAHVSAETLKQALDVSGCIVIPRLDPNLCADPCSAPVRPVHAV